MRDHQIVFFALAERARGFADGGDYVIECVQIAVELEIRRQALWRYAYSRDEPGQGSCDVALNGADVFRCLMFRRGIDFPFLDAQLANISIQSACFLLDPLQHRSKIGGVSWRRGACVRRSPGWVRKR